VGAASYTTPGGYGGGYGGGSSYTGGGYTSGGHGGYDEQVRVKKGVVSGIAMNAHRVNSSIASLFLNLATRWSGQLHDPAALPPKKNPGAH
jgi:hypothetical protein